MPAKKGKTKGLRKSLIYTIKIAVNPEDVGGFVEVWDRLLADFSMKIVDIEMVNKDIGELTDEML